MTETSPTIDVRSITDAQRRTWSSGDFHEIARHNVVMAERLCPAVDLRAGERGLDVACGTGPPRSSPPATTARSPASTSFPS